MEFQKSQIVGEHYQLIRSIGRGGFSVVWLADDLDNGNTCAIKIYAPQQGLNPEDIELFELEHKRLTELSHPNIIETKGYFKIGESPCLVLNYCPKGSLHQRIKKEGCLSESELAKLMKDIGGALHYLHSLPTPIYHLDLKPDNILIDQNDNFILTDFGISNEVRNTLLRRSAVVAETFSYRSPERALNKNLSNRHDIFSFGVVLMECCRGFYDAKFSLADSVINGYDLPPIDGYSSRLVQFLHSIVQFEPEDRPSALELMRAGEHYLDKKFWQVSTFDISKKTTRENSNPIIFDNKIEKKKQNKYYWMVILVSILTFLMIAFVIFRIMSDDKGKTPPPPKVWTQCDLIAREIDNLFQRGKFSSILNQYENFSNAGCKDTDIQNKIYLSKKCLSTLDLADNYYKREQIKEAKIEYEKYNTYGCPKDSNDIVRVRLDIIRKRMKDIEMKGESLDKINEAAKNRH